MSFLRSTPAKAPQNPPRKETPCNGYRGVKAQGRPLLNLAADLAYEVEIRIVKGQKKIKKITCDVV